MLILQILDPDPAFMVETIKGVVAEVNGGRPASRRLTLSDEAGSLVIRGEEEVVRKESQAEKWFCVPVPVAPGSRTDLEALESLGARVLRY
ncbi:MAG: hypothetical protein AAF514_08680 [Verrucomicrobiota bacterium]